MKSYIHKKVVKERSNSLETMSNITIFDNLYRDAWRYDTKRSLKRLAVEEDIEKKKKFKVKPDKRWKLGTFK